MLYLCLKSVRGHLVQEKNYKFFFDRFLNFKNIQNKQKARGLNDFNLLTTVLKYHDEVQLHSRMIGALLDPNGKHYQNTLFLEKFLKIIGLNDFEMNLSNVTIGIEYKDIDLYITDGTKHIIIENKIWADDQPCQIMKYINIIIEENKNYFNDPQENDILDESLLRVIYLSPRKKNVSSEHKINNGYIEYKDGSEALRKCSERVNTKALVPDGLKNYRAKYKKIGYKIEILSWLKESRKEIKNITNLNESISQYIAVVERVNKNYKGNVMTLENYMDDNEEMYQYLQELTKVQNNIEPKFWNELFNKLKSETSLSDTYKIEFNEKSSFKNKPEIKMISKVNLDKFIYIRRDHNTFFGFSFNTENQDLLSYFNKEQYWKHTTPKINFQKYNEEYWEIAKPSVRKQVIENIVKDIKELSQKIKELNLV